LVVDSSMNLRLHESKQRSCRHVILIGAIEPDHIPCHVLGFLLALQGKVQQLINEHPPSGRHWQAHATHRVMVDLQLAKRLHHGPPCLPGHPRPSPAASQALWHSSFSTNSGGKRLREGSPICICGFGDHLFHVCRCCIFPGRTGQRVVGEARKRQAGAIRKNRPGEKAPTRGCAPPGRHAG
jgi:hypothetical protein